MIRRNSMPLSPTSKFGIIVQNFTQSEGLFRLELESEEFNTYIAIAGSEQIAAKAAIVMVEEGINFIELCGYLTPRKLRLSRRRSTMKCRLDTAEINLLNVWDCCGNM